MIDEELVWDCSLCTDPAHVALTKMGIAVAIILGGCLLFRELTLGILDKLATRDDEEEEEDDDDKEEKEKESENEEDEEKEDDEDEDDEQMYSSYTHYDRKDTYYNRPNFYDYHNHPSYHRSLVDNECFLARIFYRWVSLSSNESSAGELYFWYSVAEQVSHVSST